MPQNVGYLTAKTDKASDEVFTAAFAVKPLLKYLRNFQQSKGREIIVWCPFDLEESEYVKIFQNEGYQVIHSHIDEGKNFFFYEPDEYDIIISNPASLDVSTDISFSGTNFTNSSNAISA